MRKTKSHFTEYLTRSGMILLFLALFSGLSAQDYQADLSLPLAEFEKESLAPKDQVWVVDFWATWCRPCIQSIPHMKELQARYQDKDVLFISISWDRNEIKWLSALNHFEMPWKHLIVPKGKEDWLERNFPHRGIPTAFVINKAGKAKKVNDVYKLQKAIDKAL